MKLFAKIIYIKYISSSKIIYIFVTILYLCYRTAVLYVVSNLVVGVLAVCLVYQWIGAQMPVVTIPETFVYTVAYDAAVNYSGELRELWPILMFLVIICTGFASMVSNYFSSDNSVGVSGIAMPRINNIRFWLLSPSENFQLRKAKKLIK